MESVAVTGIADVTLHGFVNVGVDVVCRRVVGLGVLGFTFLVVSVISSLFSLNMGATLSVFMDDSVVRRHHRMVFPGPRRSV